MINPVATNLAAAIAALPRAALNPAAVASRAVAKALVTVRLPLRTIPPREPILLPGESLAKYRGKPAASAPPVEHLVHEEQPDVEDLLPSRAMNVAPAALPGSPAATPGAPGAGGPRRFSGGLPRWLLAEESVTDAPASEEESRVDTDASAQRTSDAGDDSAEEVAPLVLPSARRSEESEPPVRGDVDLNEDQVASLASEFAEAKHEETQDHAVADAVVGGAEFDDEEDEEEAAEEEAAAREEAQRAEDQQEDSDEDDREEELQVRQEAVESHSASAQSEAEADAATKKPMPTPNTPPPWSLNPHLRIPATRSAKFPAKLPAKLRAKLRAKLPPSSKKKAFSSPVKRALRVPPAPLAKISPGIPPA